MSNEAENNKLIAEFMGYRYETGVTPGGSWSRFFKVGGTFEDSFPSPKYHTSWDWLMPVIEKIGKLIVDRRDVLFTIGSAGIWIALNQSNWTGEKFPPCVIANTLNVNYFANDESEETPKIEAVYFGVIKFINWYNTHSSQREKETK